MEPNEYDDGYIGNLTPEDRDAMYEAIMEDDWDSGEMYYMISLDF